jgi:hypothetical protein
MITKRKSAHIEENCYCILNSQDEGYENGLSGWELDVSEEHDASVCGLFPVVSCCLKLDPEDGGDILLRNVKTSQNTGTFPQM